MRKLKFDHAQLAAKLLTNSFRVGTKIATKALAGNFAAGQLPWTP